MTHALSAEVHVNSLQVSPHFCSLSVCLCSVLSLSLQRGQISPPAKRFFNLLSSSMSLPAVSLSSLATVEFQLVMHGLDRSSLLKFALCTVMLVLRSNLWNHGSGSSNDGSSMVLVLVLRFQCGKSGLQAQLQRTCAWRVAEAS